jgi:mRNA interferase MazF
MPKLTVPQRGEIWLVNFDPTVGNEIQKIRPAIVISSNAIGKLSIKLVAPLTDWKPYFDRNLWHLKITPDSTNGLSKTSAMDALQLRGMDTQRFIRKLGHLPAETMTELTLTIAAVIEADL